MTDAAASPAQPVASAPATLAPAAATVPTTLRPPRLRLALAQVDPTVGDLAGNSALIRGHARKAAEAGADLVICPEMVLTGYPVEDLVFRDSFVAASRAAVESLATELADDGLGDVVVVVGYLDADGPPRMNAEATPGKGPRNAAAVLAGGQVTTRYFKHHLPNYGVFDEDRYFMPGRLHRRRSRTRWAAGGRS